MKTDDKAFAEEVRKKTIQTYNMGFNAACKTLIEGLNLIPVQTLSVGDVIKMINTVQRINNNECIKAEFLK